MDKIRAKKDERMIDYFIIEIKRQCEYVQISLNYLDNSIKNRLPAEYTFYNLHNLFNNLGNISKLLYPKSGYRTRGKELRELLNIKKDTQFDFDKDRNVLRKYRNIMEHYDEYFEDWYKKGDNSIVIDGNVGPINMVKIEGIETKYLRHFIPSEYKFIFLDDEYDLKPVIRETQDIYNRIIQIEGDKVAITR